MKEKSFSRFSGYCVVIVTVAIWAVLAWSHFHGGVPSHHLLAKKEIPAISNWWGGLLLPLLTWFLLHRIHKRSFYKVSNSPEASQSLLREGYGFVGSLLFGVAISVLFTLSESDLAGNMMLALLVFAFFYPIYRPECLLGFVLGMTFTFGVVLPTLIGTLLGLIGLVLYAYIRPALLYVVSKLAFLLLSRS
jgi:hypothetical protein